MDDDDATAAGLVLVGEEHLGMHEAALLDGDPAAELERLGSHGYRRGSIRRYRSADGYPVVVTVYRFSSDRAASFYRDDGRDHLLAQLASVAPVGQGFVASVVDIAGLRWHLASLASADWHVAGIADGRTGVGPGGVLRVARAHLTERASPTSADG